MDVELIDRPREELVLDAEYGDLELVHLRVALFVVERLRPGIGVSWETLGQVWIDWCLDRRVPMFWPGSEHARPSSGIPTRERAALEIIERLRWLGADDTHEGTDSTDYGAWFLMGWEVAP